MLQLCWELKILDFREVLALPNDVLETWLQYAAHMARTPVERRELSPSQTGDLVRGMFGGKGIVRA